MREDWKALWRGAGLAAGLLLGGAAVWGALWLEVHVNQGACTENSPVEFGQMALLAATGMILWWAGAKRREWRGGLALAGGFFLAALARECDGWLDPLAKWAWMVPALGVAGVAGVSAWRNRGSIVPGLAAICRTRHFGVLAAGMSILLGFSRMFGRKATWIAVLGEEEYRVVKNVAEESLELLGDMLIFVWLLLALAEWFEGHQGTGKEGEG